MRIIGLISSYDEGGLLEGAVRSALDANLDSVLVFEGPTDGSRMPTIEETIPIAKLTLKHNSTILKRGNWTSDAGKRTAMVRYARQKLNPEEDEPLWGVWIDGDELLLWGENLRPYLERISYEEDAKGAGFKFPLRLVELDGNVALCHGKVVRIDLVDEYVRSSSDITFKMWPGLVRVLGNEPNWRPARLSDDGETILEQQWAQTPLQRPPLHGEPHLLHRSALRHPARAGLRLHDAEATEWEQMRKAAGLVNVG